MYCAGKLQGAIQLFEHLICCSELTIVSIFLVLGDTLGIELECIEGSASAAKSNDDAPPSMPVDIFQFRRNLAKARFPALADLTDKTLRGDYVLVFKLKV